MKIKHSIFALVLATSLTAMAWPASAQMTEQVPPPRLKWSFAGPFGKYDEAQLQRGFKIYREVCANCHSMEMVAFRSLADPGGPGFSEAQAEAVAADYKIKDLDDQGNQIERAGRPADYFPPPFANELAAKAANGGTAPPDMSTLAKARGYSRGFPWFIFDADHAISGAGRRLHRGHRQRLQGSAARRLQAAAGRPLQRIFPRPRHRHAAAAAAGAGDL